MQYARIAVDPRGERLAVSAAGGRVLVVSLSGGATRELEGFSERAIVGPVAFSPNGRHLAAATRQGPAAEKVIRVWDLESGVARVLGPFPGAGDGEEGAMSALSFLDDDRLLACSPASGVMLLDLRDGSRKQLSSRPSWAIAVGRRKGVVLAMLGKPVELVRLDLEGRVTRVASCPRCSSVALDPTESLLPPAAWTASCAWGPSPEESPLSSSATRAGSSASRSRPTAAGSPRAGTTTRSVSGLCRTSRRHRSTSGATRKSWPRSGPGRTCASCRTRRPRPAGSSSRARSRAGRRVPSW